MTVAVLVATAIWHALATYHFLFFPARTLARTTRDRPVSPLAAELFRFLGGLNAALVVLAATAVFAGPEARRLALLVLALANLSQAGLDLRVRRLELAHGPFFLQVLAGDVAFTALNGAALAVDVFRS